MDSLDTPMSSSTTFFQCKYGRVRLLTADNYPEWSSSLTNFLKADKTWKIVQGTEFPPIPPVTPAASSSQASTARTRGRSEPDEATIAAQNAFDTKQDDFESRSAMACAMISSSVSPSFQQFVYAMTDPALMWSTLKAQLDSMDSNAGPCILRAQFFREKYSSGSISVFFAKLMQYQTRLLSTDFRIQDVDLISHILSYGTLPQRFDSTVEVLRLQPNQSWSTLTQILVNKEIQMKTLIDKPNIITSSSALVSTSKHQKKKNKKQKQEKKRLRIEEVSDSDSNSDKLKESKDIQCYYCFRYGYKVTDCKLREWVKKIRG